MQCHREMACTNQFGGRWLVSCQLDLLVPSLHTSLWVGLPRAMTYQKPYAD